MRSERGQALMMVVGMLWLGMLATLVLGGVASGMSARADRQRAADLVALAAAKAMRASYDRLFEPAEVGGQANSRRLSRDAYLAQARAVELVTARRNGARATAEIGR